MEPIPVTNPSNVQPPAPPVEHVAPPPVVNVGRLNFTTTLYTYRRRSK